MTARRAARAAAVGLVAGESVVPVHLLPITTRERREAYLEGRPYPMNAVQDRSRALDVWFREHGLLRTDYVARNEAIQRSREQLKSEERQASHSAPSQRMRKR